MGDVVDSVVNVATLGTVDTDFSGKEAGKDARRAASGAAATQAAYQREALDYLKERERLPQQFREGALTRLGGLYGLEGGEGSQAELIEQAKASPLYSSLLEGGEDAALRTASMTGGLRSGGSISDVKDVQNQALLTSYNQQLQGIQGLANLPSNAPMIAQGTAGIGQTLSQGQIAGSQAEIQAANLGFNQLMGIAQVGTQAATAAFSDIRLKENIQLVGAAGGHNWYKWDWNEEAANVGLYGGSEGVMAHELYEVSPDLVGHRDGYITVNYEKLAPANINAEYEVLEIANGR